MEIRIPELAQQLKPYLIGFMADAGIVPPGGTWAPSPHNLTSAHHNGTLSDAQGPQFLLANGTRNLTGNLTVDPGITIDGYDVSAVGGDVAALKTRNINTTNGLQGGGNLTADRTLSVLLPANSGMVADVTGLYIGTPSTLTVSTANGVTASTHTHAITSSSNPGSAASLLATDVNGAATLVGLTVNHANLAGTALIVQASGNGPWTMQFYRSDIPVRTYFNHNSSGTVEIWNTTPAIRFQFYQTGDLTLYGGLTTGNTSNMFTILPVSTDTYDLGSSTKLWRKGWLSELDAILFAQQTITLLGGWLIVGKDEGTIPVGILVGDTTVDFGKAMTVGHFVLFRSVGKVEYMQVGALVAGTVYNVTRNLDGSGADAWPAGEPFSVLGTVGDGRIELDAYDTPRISITKQGATYNAQTEMSRWGDLNGNWGYAVETYGIALGDYAANHANMTWDPTNGLRIRSYTTTVIQLDNAGTATIQNANLTTLNVSGALTMGASGTIRTASSGARIELTNTQLASYDGLNQKQFWIDATTGIAYAGVNTSFDDYGMHLSNAAGIITWGPETSPTGMLFNNINGTQSTTWLKGVQENTSGHGYVTLSAEGNLTYTASYAQLTVDVATGVYISNSGTNSQADLRVGGGLYVGGTLTDPAVGSIYATGNINGATMGDTSTYTPTAVGINALPTGDYRWYTIGKIVIVTIYMYNNATSTGTTFTLTAPFTSANYTYSYWFAPILFVDNGAFGTQPGKAQLPPNSNVITLYTNYYNGAWNGGAVAKRASFTLIYEKA